MTDLVLHEYAASGNCYKIRLTASHVGVVLQRREYDIMSGETRSLAFLSEVNRNGRIPVLQIGDRFLPESNAACVWLADGSALIPTDRFDRADMLRWMFFEQYSHEPNVATLRFWLHLIGETALSDMQRAQIASKRTGGEAALALMEEHLASQRFFVADMPTLADICLYAYTHVAEEGSFDLGHFPAVRRWIDAVAALPRHVAMED